MNSNNRLSVTLNTVFPRDIVRLRNVRINILHKGHENDDDDNNNNNNNTGIAACLWTKQYLSIDLT